ncbi:MAG: hypothetical protein CMF22_11910 [Idiomarinaceae bacterium]|nr:hypothetical protein [Idiomarinaceae bacterium]|tara:strand:+ start:24977 stop:25201 length:225 start_codon:yes stop_codon:yes gene_type:complete
MDLNVVVFLTLWVICGGIIAMCIACWVENDDPHRFHTGRLMVFYSILCPPVGVFLLTIKLWVKIFIKSEWRKTP